MKQFQVPCCRLAAFLWRMQGMLPIVYGLSLVVGLPFLLGDLSSVWALCLCKRSPFSISSMTLLVVGTSSLTNLLSLLGVATVGAPREAAVVVSLFSCIALTICSWMCGCPCCGRLPRIVGWTLDGLPLCVVVFSGSCVSTIVARMISCGNCCRLPVKEFTVTDLSHGLADLNPVLYGGPLRKWLSGKVWVEVPSICSGERVCDVKYS